MAAKVIAVLNPKGGVGKTMLATHIASRTQSLKKETLLVDTDNSTTSARKWVAMALAQAKEDGEEYQGPKVVAVDDPNLLENSIPRLAEDNDFIVIDGAAMAQDMVVSAIMVADLVVIPIQPSRADIDNGIDTAKLVAARAKLTGKPAAAFALSRVTPGTVISRDSRAQAEKWAPVLQTELPNSVRFQESYSGGITIFDHAQGGKFAEAMDGMIMEILKILVEQG
ncbi:AAA family ATPase [Microbulbifer sp. PSTR4-B]|uniref:AAA family ATPase n=1 Tax=unclassified Microbulbifer TaxID=2619833 RepID=UPI00403A95CB